MNETRENNANFEHRRENVLLLCSTATGHVRVRQAIVLDRFRSHGCSNGFSRLRVLLLTDRRFQRQGLSAVFLLLHGTVRSVLAGWPVVIVILIHEMRRE